MTESRLNFRRPKNISGTSQSNSDADAEREQRMATCSISPTVTQYSGGSEIPSELEDIIYSFDTQSSACTHFRRGARQHF